MRQAHFVTLDTLIRRTVSSVSPASQAARATVSVMLPSSLATCVGRASCERSTRSGGGGAGAASSAAALGACPDALASACAAHHAALGPRSQRSLIPET